MSFSTSPGQSPSLAGQTLHHAAAVIELLPTLLRVVVVSNPVSVVLAP